MKIIMLTTEVPCIVQVGNLLCTSENHLKQNMLLFIQNGLIKEILPAEKQNIRALSSTGLNIAGASPFKFKTKKNKQSFFIDLSNYTVMPGLVDCHVHLALNGAVLQKCRHSYNKTEEITRQVAKNLKNTLSHGILAVRDGGDRARIGLEFREKVQKREFTGPLITATGSVLRKSGMYGAFLGRGIVGNLAEAVSRLAGAGVNQIKVLVTGIVSFQEYGRVGPLQFNQEELELLVNKAHLAGLKVMAHANSDQAVNIAARSGVDSIEHGYFLSRSTLEMLAGLDIPWVPTVVPLANQVTRNSTYVYSRQQQVIIEKTYRKQLDAIAEAAELGVTLGVGTDAGSPGVPHGESYLQELKLYRQAGLAPGEILRAATVNGARIAGVEQKLGLVQKGIPPNLIAIQGNPLKELSALKNIEYVIMVR